MTQKSVDRLVQELNEKYTPEGAKVPVVSRSSDRPQQEFIPCTSPALGFVLGTGGWPLGHLVEMFGKEHAGKTTLMMLGLKEAYEYHDGNRAIAYIDVEHRYNEEWARKLGLPSDLIVVQPENGEQATDIMHKLIKPKIISDGVCAIGFDSVGAASPTREQASFEDRAAIMGGNAMIMTRNVRTIAPVANLLGTTVFYCLAGSTEVVTKKGIVPIRELSGEEAEVLTEGGKWVSAPFRSFGVAPTYSIKVSRHGFEKTIRATGNHRWPVLRGSKDRRYANKTEVVTSDLVPGDFLVSCHPKSRGQVTPSPIGVMHGFVYGDGTRGSTGPSHVNIYDSAPKDEQMLKYFEAFPWSRDENEHYSATRINNLPRAFKDLPDPDEHLGYLYGWLAGYFAADGTVVDGRPSLSSVSRASLEFARDVCVRMGIDYDSIIETSSGGFGANGDGGFRLTFPIGALPKEFFLLDVHRQGYQPSKRARSGWTVVSIEEAGEEEVFCATVPDTHTFALEGFILTGNSNQLRADMEGYRRVMTPGGQALKHAMSVRLYLWPNTDPKSKKHDKIDGQDVQVGFEMNFRVVKSNFGPPHRDGKSAFYFRPSRLFEGIGFDIEQDVQALGIMTEVIHRAGAYYSYEDVKVQGREPFFKEIKEKGLYDQLLKDVNSRLDTAFSMFEDDAAKGEHYVEIDDPEI